MHVNKQIPAVIHSNSLDIPSFCRRLPTAGIHIDFIAQYSYCVLTIDSCVFYFFISLFLGEMSDLLTNCFHVDNVKLL